VLRNRIDVIAWWYSIILVGIILPLPKSRNLAFLLCLCPVEDLLIHCWVFEVFGRRHGVGVCGDIDGGRGGEVEMRLKSRWKEEEREEAGGGGGWSVEYMWRMMHLVGRCRA